MPTSQHEDRHFSRQLRSTGIVDNVSCLNRALLMCIALYSTINAFVSLRALSNHFQLVYQCDPLGDQNVFGFLRDPHSPPPSASSVVIVSARLDTTSFFENVYPGADSPASGIVALLATAHTLKKVEAKVFSVSGRYYVGWSVSPLVGPMVVWSVTSIFSAHIAIFRVAQRLITCIQKLITRVLIFQTTTAPKPLPHYLSTHNSPSTSRSKPPLKTCYLRFSTANLSITWDPTALSST